MFKNFASFFGLGKNKKSTANVNQRISTENLNTDSKPNGY